MTITRHGRQQLTVDRRSDEQLRRTEAELRADNLALRREILRLRCLIDAKTAALRARRALDEIRAAYARARGGA